MLSVLYIFFLFQAEDGIRDFHVTGVQTCALPTCRSDLLTSCLSLREPLRGCCLWIALPGEGRGSACAPSSPASHSSAYGQVTRPLASCALQVTNADPPLVDVTVRRAGCGAPFSSIQSKVVGAFAVVAPVPS